MYKLTDEGVLRLSDGSHITCRTNRDWLMYEKWLEDGNTPEPEFTQDELVTNTLNTEILELKDDLRNAQVWMFRMIAELYKVNKINGALNVHYDSTVLDKMQDWNQKLNRLKEIDE